MPPEDRTICRFAAEPPQSALAAGEWAHTLRAEFLAACLRIESDDDELGEPGDVTWYPDRTWWGRTYVPATARTSTDLELYGYVSFAPGDGVNPPGDFHAWADYTDETAERHPEWRMDLCEEVIGGWRGEPGHVAAMTLVWGVPTVPGGAVATAELGGIAVDQCELREDRFTLVAPDAYGDDYLEVVLWGAGREELARESLYSDDEDEDDDAA